jgi:hypothetical protein
MDRTPVIAGIGLSDYPVAKDLDSVQHHALAYQRVLADCGVENSAIDAYFGAYRIGAAAARPCRRAARRRNGGALSR